MMIFQTFSSLNLDCVYDWTRDPLYCMMYAGYYITSSEAKQKEKEKKQSGKTINNWSFWWNKLEIEWTWFRHFNKEKNHCSRPLFIIIHFWTKFLYSSEKRIDVDYGTFEHRNVSFWCSKEETDVNGRNFCFYFCKINWQRYTNLALKLILQSLE